jgi:ParB-like chromosome segregation protein Spo0J
MPRGRRLSIPKNLKGPKGTDEQPVSDVRWVPRELVNANDYNPNHVAPPEMRLLKISLLVDGWTQPLVVREVPPEVPSSVGDGDEFKTTYELVDGYHRWLAAEDKKIAAMTGGQVPISLVPEKPLEDRMMSTIRHNRARGEHKVLDMAKITTKLVDAGFDDGDIGDLLQMDSEEVRRLREFGNMRRRGAKDEFNKGWTPQ